MHYTCISMSKYRRIEMILMILLTLIIATLKNSSEKLTRDGEDGKKNKKAFNRSYNQETSHQGTQEIYLLCQLDHKLVFLF